MGFIKMTISQLVLLTTDKISSRLMKSIDVTTLLAVRKILGSAVNRLRLTKVKVC